MTVKPDTCLGISIVNERTPFTFCAVNVRLQVTDLKHGELADVQKWIAMFPHAFVAVNAPSRTNKGLMKMTEVRKTLNPPPTPGHWTNLRVLEYELRRRGIRTPRTPEASADCPTWMHLGFGLYQALQECGFSPYPHNENPQQWMEIQAETSFYALAGNTLLEGHTLEGRLQRQMILYNCGLGIKDPMTFFEEVTSHRLLHGNLPVNLVYELKELNALVAAYTAWLAANRPQQVMRLGAIEEGQVITPSSDELENIGLLRQISIFGIAEIPS
ncbi:MAG: hypothetical protein HPY45_11860 [Anaerolineae bacterium]|nr:hypothetical protein [Anaerolineae bacterium]